MNKNHIQRIRQVSLKWLPGIFVLIPLVVVALKLANIATNIATNMMIACLFVISLYLLKLAVNSVRWRSMPAPPEPQTSTPYKSRIPVDTVRTVLTGEGYVFHTGGEYAERGRFRRCAHGMVFFLLALLLLAGCYDNLRALSGMIFVNTGDPRPLDSIKEYSFYSQGPLARLSEIAYKIKGVRLILPDSTYPLGAMDVRLLTMDESSSWQSRLIAMGKGFQKDDFDVSLIALEYDVILTVLVNGNHVVFTDSIHFIPKSSPADSFTHEGKLKLNERDDLDGTAQFDPVTDHVRLQIRHKDERFQTELGKAPEHEKSVGDYVIRNEGILRSGQIRVIRKRHMKTLMVFAGLAAVSALALTTPRRRLWLRNGDDGGSVLRGDDAVMLNRVMTDESRCEVKG